MTKQTSRRRQIAGVPSTQSNPSNANQDRESVADAQETAPVAVVPSAGVEDVRRRAYDLYCGRGRTDGYDVHDWCQAERDLLGGELNHESP